MIDVIVVIAIIIVAIGAATFPLWGPYIVDPNAEENDYR